MSIIIQPLKKHFFETDSRFSKRLFNSAHAYVLVYFLCIFTTYISEFK